MLFQRWCSIKNSLYALENSRVDERLSSFSLLEIIGRARTVSLEELLFRVAVRITSSQSEVLLHKATNLMKPNCNDYFTNQFWMYRLKYHYTSSSKFIPIPHFYAHPIRLKVMCLNPDLSKMVLKQVHFQHFGKCNNISGLTFFPINV